MRSNFNFRSAATHYTLHPRNLSHKRGLRRKKKVNNNNDDAPDHKATICGLFAWIILGYGPTLAVTIAKIVHCASALVLLAFAVTLAILVDVIALLSIVTVLLTLQLMQQYTQEKRPFHTLVDAFLLGVSPLYVAAHHENYINHATFSEAGRWLIFRCDGYRRMSRRKFKAYFGADPEICADIWQMINPPEEVSRYARPMHLLWGLLLMKVYATEEVLSGIAGVTEKTFRKWAWKFIKEVADLSYSLVSCCACINAYRARFSKVSHKPIMHQISLEDRFNDDIGNIVKLSLDGTDCPINEPRPFNRLWWTKKFNGPGVRYEIALNIRTGEICWINGPFQCGPWPDGSIFMNGL